MKAAILVICGITAFDSVSVLGQDAAPPTVDLSSHKPAENNTEPTNSPAPAPTPSLPDVSQLDQVFHQNSLGKVADQQKFHVEWRRLANQAVNDPAVIAAKAAVETARTDLEKRQRLRVYYDTYYGRMRAMAGTAEMKAALDEQKQTHLSQINQPRVRPDTDAGLPTPIPARKQHKKKD